MPLPKSSSIAARATEAYAEAWSVVLHDCWDMKPPRDEPLPPLTQLLPFIRQLLTCCACAGLLEDAMVSVSCGHCYCSKCQSGTPLLKIQCRQCRERTGLVIENQIRIVVQCFRHMCHVLSDHLEKCPAAAATVKGGEFTLAKGRETPDGFNPVTEILSEVISGVNVSRTVLLVLPPQKYLNPKPPPDPPMPKKEQSSPGAGRKDPPTTLSEKDAEMSAENSDVLSQNEEEDPGDLDNEKPSTSPVNTHTQSTKSSRTTKKDKKRKRLKPNDETNKPSAKSPKHTPPSVKLAVRKGVKDIATAQFHATVEFGRARLKSAQAGGEMQLFLHSDFLRLKQTVPQCDAVVDLQVCKECFDRDFVVVSDSVFKAREDLPSFLPQSFSAMPSSRILSYPDRKPAPSNSSSSRGKMGVSKILPRSRTPLTPRAKFKLLRPKYKSPFLHTSVHDPTPPKKKPPITPLPQPSSSLKTPSIKLTLASCGGPPPTTAPVVKKKKRSPMTPGHWRCRCGTNNPQTFDRICARGKCPCFVKNIPCINCLCRHCKNPFNSSSD